MQQNVQSQRPKEVAAYSQQRNSNPSKIPDSQIIREHRSAASFQQNPIQLQIIEPKHQSNNEKQDELKKINEEIKKQKDLIEKLRLQKQEIQNNMNKSYLSLSPNLFEGHRNDDFVSGNDDLLETKTQADLSFLENRKNIATKQLQTQEDKYKENIRKMQLKRSEMKRKLKEDQEIPIKIMDFKELEKKKEIKEDEHQNMQNNKSINKDKSVQKQPSTKQEQQEKIDQIEQIEQIDQVIIETESKKPTSQKLELNEEPIQKSQISKKSDLNKQQNVQHEASQKRSELINRSKFSQHKSQSKADDQNSCENKSRISQMNSNKRYSVKKSSVIVPQSNQSIKEIQERRDKQSQKVLSHKQSHLPNHEINLEPEASHKSRSRVSSVKKSQAKESVHSQKDSDHKQKQQKSVKEDNSVKESAKSKSVHQEPEKSEEKSVQSEQIHNADKIIKETTSVKEKSVSMRSKKSQKSQKVELMYIHHAPKQLSHKSFKKTDKSIQWSEVDMSMYGKTNEVLHSHNNSQLISEFNQQNHPLKEETQESRVSNQMEINQINMKKNKNNDQIMAEEVSHKQKRSQRASNLAPLKSNKQKSQKQSIHSKVSQSKGSFVAASRQGSVKQKTERYDQFHREHSLDNKKIESKKLAMIQNINATSGNKQSSYRSRKSNPISNLNASRSKAQTVVVNQGNPSQKAGKSQIEAGKSQIVKNLTSEMNESKVLISKQEITLLHSQINKLEEKLLNIEAKQQKLAKQKEDELVKLQQIVVEEEKMTQEAQKSQIFVINQQNDEIQNLLINILIPEQQSESKQLVDGENPTEVNQEKVEAINEANENEEPKDQINMQKSFISQKNTIQKQIDQIAQIQKKFNHEKEELLQEINKLKKTIRELQIQKIKSIDHNQTITSKDDNKSKRPDTEMNEFGVIVHQNKLNKTIDPIMIEDQEESGTVSIGKIVKNQSPQKNSSRLIENMDSRTKSIDRKFRINISKKSSILSQNLFGKQFDSAEISGKGMNSLVYDDEGNEQLQRKKKDFYPINAKDGYMVISPQHQNRQQQILHQQDFQLPAEKEEIKLPDISESKIRRAELMKDEILEKFHRTNRQFNNFVESSRIINETNSSMSSQNNLFFDKTHHSSAFSNKKVSNQEEQDNPQAIKFLNKMSDSNFEIHKEASKNEFQQNFTKIVENIKNQVTDENESDDELQQIEVRDVEMPELSRTPDITYDQDQLIKLAQETFKVFGIEVNYEDADFNMKKYKNCVIFTKGSQTILWHYNGKFYIGGWKGKEDGSGQKTGYGIEIVPDKHIYKGQFMNGKKHGTGIMKTTNGNIYDGQWIEGIKNGQGVYYDSTTKVVYSGEWKDGKKNGFGILKFSEKQYYKGTFVKSVKDGFGTQVFINGDKYRGEYRKGKFHGKGKYTWANTSSFEGDFVEGMRHGNGSWKSAKINGDIYVGAYQNDKKSGYGRYIWSNGCIYQGNFAEDVKHGKGRLIYKDGKQIKGIWQEGTLLEAVTQNQKQYNQEQILRRGSKLKAK